MHITVFGFERVININTEKTNCGAVCVGIRRCSNNTRRGRHRGGGVCACVRVFVFVCVCVCVRKGRAARVKSSRAPSRGEHTTVGKNALCPEARRDDDGRRGNAKKTDTTTTIRPHRARFAEPVYARRAHTRRTRARTESHTRGVICARLAANARVTSYADNAYDRVFLFINIFLYYYIHTSHTTTIKRISYLLL